MQISGMLILSGPNIWSRKPVMEILLTAEPHRPDSAQRFHDQVHGLIRAHLGPHDEGGGKTATADRLVDAIIQRGKGGGMAWSR